MKLSQGPLPKYFRIYEELMRDIREGKYKNGEKFPSDTELVKNYGVSRGTIREAIKLLFQQGYLIREQGKGTFVTYSRIHQDPDKLMGFSELMKTNNIKPSAKIIEKEVIPVPANVSHIMKANSSDKVVRIVRLRFGDEQPLIIERSFFNYRLFEPILNEDFEQNSIFGLLYRYTHVRLGEAEQRIEAISAGSEEQELLNVKVGTPLLLMKRIIKTSEGAYFQYSEDVYRSDRINFTTTTFPYDEHHDDHGIPLELSSSDW